MLGLERLSLPPKRSFRVRKKDLSQGTQQTDVSTQRDVLRREKETTDIQTRTDIRIDTGLGMKAKKREASRGALLYTVDYQNRLSRSRIEAG